MQKSSFLLYSNLTLSLHIVYELNSWPRNQTNTFPIKKCLFGIVKLIRNTIKTKCTYNGQGTAFDGEGSLIFGNDFTRNVVIFGVNNI